MHAALKHFAVLGVASVASLAAYNFVANADDGSQSVPAEFVQDTLQDFALGQGEPYELSELKLLQRTIYFVDEKYVDPNRVDPDLMFDEALDSVERRVGEVLFRREPGGRLLHIAVGSYTTTLELPPIETTRVMTDQLSRVAAVLEAELSSDEVPFPEIEYALVNGVLSSLDPHSVLLPPEDSKEMDVENSGEFGGLGITIALREGRLTVEYPLEDTPAYRVGLKADDRIVRIDGQSTINMDLTEAVSKLRGEVGTTVQVHVERDGWNEPKPFDIERARIKINPVKGELLEGGVGYVRVTNFHGMVTNDLTALMAQFARENGGNLRGLVLDLRSNPGGYLNQAVDVSDMFLSNGQIVSTVERGNRNVDSQGASRGNTEGDYPIIILVNANSASASEIVAGALKNNGRAVILGERTFGKGSVQHLYENPGDDSKLKLTVAKYLTPGEHSIQAIGVPPDILVEQTIMVDDPDAEDDRPLVAMYARERVRREADLDHSLEQMENSGDPAVYSVRFLYQPDPDQPRSDQLNLNDDWEVQFARDLILASPEDANRAEVLSSVGSVVSTHGKRQAKEIEGAFSDAGLDWSSGDQPATPSLTVEVDLGEDGVLTAGEEHEEMVWVRVTNTGTEPVHQVMAVSESTLDFLDGDEFYVGKLAPGETRSWPTRVALIEGYRDEVGEVDITVYDGSRRELAQSTHMVRTVGQPLPRFSWTYEIRDSGVEGVHGDGDGIAEAGETVALHLELTNVGDGATSEAFAKIKNKSSGALDLEVGVLELGVIEPGETAEGDFLFKVKGTEPLELDFKLGDQLKYDYSAIWRGGFYELSGQGEHLVIPVATESSWDTRTPPAIDVTRQPGLVSGDGQVVLSGVVKDDKGLRDVIVYRTSEDDGGKIFFQGGTEGVTTLPFTVDARLDVGWNLFVVVARDGEGLTDVQSVSVWYDEDGTVKLAQADIPLGG
ncbi:MAG: PDZ domain-containing protein [Proteobacteria bacterium]|nr:PDZ domain-containing protein [Pseudomonadota bacterium]MCP4920411.1 PDZ domain-containing protein [Pseudomonadota bacterium]